MGDLHRAVAADSDQATGIATIAATAADALNHDTDRTVAFCDDGVERSAADRRIHRSADTPAATAAADRRGHGRAASAAQPGVRRVGPNHRQ